MTSRRWRDPRTQRTWEVTVTGLASPDRSTTLPRRRHAVCFDTTGTPRQGFLVACCERAEGVFPEMRDQDLALCLEAARHGGLLWVDPRDGELWWIRQKDDALELRSAADAATAPWTANVSVSDLDDDELGALLDEVLPARSSTAA